MAVVVAAAVAVVVAGPGRAAAQGDRGRAGRTRLVDEIVAAWRHRGVARTLPRSTGRGALRDLRRPALHVALRGASRRAKFSELLTEFEPILKALKITIDDKTIAAFIANVRSVKYQSKADLLASFIEIQSEGTHEKKLFKEAGVFKKAQQASQIWQQNMQSMLGRITLNNAA